MKRKDEDLILLNSYLDHELNDSEMLTFTQHLSQDPSLAAELDELIAVKSKFAALRETKAPRKYILTRAEARRPGNRTFSNGFSRFSAPARLRRRWRSLS